ncbi:hypothetical protein C1X72_19175 [Pseudomonas sp. FW306-2-2C-D06B]|nr:hypothetical protein C1X72_19175 [Pseudomonas sp. FW306-2-2C-D06B]
MAPALPVFAGEPAPTGTAHDVDISARAAAQTTPRHADANASMLQALADTGRGVRKPHSQ